MGHATPYERVHLPIPVLRRPEGPEVLDPYPPASQPQSPIPQEILDRIRKDPWALQAIDPELRERPEVLRAAVDSGHPQALEAISVYVPPEVLRRPEIYDWLREYRRQILPARVFFFQGTVGLAFATEGAGWALGGEIGGGGPRVAAKLFYDRLSDADGEIRQQLGLEASALLYPAKRISMHERQTVLALGLPVATSYVSGGSEGGIGLSLAYYLARGERLVSPLFGMQARLLMPFSDPLGSPSAAFELQVPVWSTLEGVERLGRRLRRP
ncbi:MAG: hypothetical protein IT573_03495 [Deltaproteobacteria bacterium]|nr:hypothetical protein [Deltaproteobacteria bacterium]